MAHHNKDHILELDGDDNVAEGYVPGGCGAEGAAIDLMDIVAKSVVLDTVIQSGNKAGRVAQLQDEIDGDIVKYSQAKFRDQNEEKILNLRTNLLLLHDKQTRLERANAKLLEHLLEVSRRLETLEQQAAAMTAAKRSPRADVEPPKRPVAESLSRPISVVPPTQQSQRPFTVFDGTRSVRVG